MAFQMEFNDIHGVTHPASYWRVAQTNFSQADKRGQIIFHGYASAAARLAGKQAIECKFYDINQADYEAYFAPDDLNPEGKNPVEAAYTYALTVKEGDAPLADEEGYVSEDTRVSFFGEAEEV